MFINFQTYNTSDSMKRILKSLPNHEDGNAKTIRPDVSTYVSNTNSNTRTSGLVIPLPEFDNFLIAMNTRQGIPVHGGKIV